MNSFTCDLFVIKNMGEDLGSLPGFRFDVGALMFKTSVGLVPLFQSRSEAEKILMPGQEIAMVRVMLTELK